MLTAIMAVRELAALSVSHSELNLLTITDTLQALPLQLQLYLYRPPPLLLLLCPPLPPLSVARFSRSLLSVI